MFIEAAELAFVQTASTGKGKCKHCQAADSWVVSHERWES